MTSKFSKQQWVDLIGQQEQSSLSIAEFCRTHTINAKHFYYHRRKRLASVTDDHNSTAFVRATMACNNSASGRPSTEAIHLQHKQSDLRLPSTISPAWLAALMVALA